MADPEDIKQCNCVAPTAPTDATAARDNSPGQVESVTAGQQQKTTGQYGSQSVKAHTTTDENKDKTHWIEVVLIDDADQPVPGASVDIECPDGSVASCTTDDQGKARVDHLDPGQCKITFPDLDKDAWEPA